MIQIKNIWIVVLFIGMQASCADLDMFKPLNHDKTDEELENSVVYLGVCRFLNGINKYDEKFDAGNPEYNFYCAEKDIWYFKTNEKVSGLPKEGEVGRDFYREKNLVYRQFGGVRAYLTPDHKILELRYEHTYGGSRLPFFDKNPHLYMGPPIGFTAYSPKLQKHLAKTDYLWGKEAHDYQLGKVLNFNSLDNWMPRKAAHGKYVKNVNFLGQFTAYEFKTPDKFVYTGSNYPIDIFVPNHVPNILILCNRLNTPKHKDSICYVDDRSIGLKEVKYSILRSKLKDFDIYYKLVWGYLNERTLDGKPELQ